MKKPSLERNIESSVIEDLRHKMVFLGGARQVGKTTLAWSILNSADTANANHPGYLNWDNPGVRSRLLRGELPANQKLLVLDEIHKYPRWRNLVKVFSIR